MAMHEFHPREGLPGEPVLFDDCGECARQAEHPARYLDQHKMRELWDRMVLVEHDQPGLSYRSANEATAGRWCYDVALFLERFAGIDPWMSLPEMTFTTPFRGSGG